MLVNTVLSNQHCSCETLPCQGYLPLQLGQLRGSGKGGCVQPSGVAPAQKAKGNYRLCFFPRIKAEYLGVNWTFVHDFWAHRARLAAILDLGQNPVVVI